MTRKDSFLHQQYTPEELMANPMNYPTYRKVFEDVARELSPGDQLSGDTNISFFGKKNPVPLDFCLTSHDRVPVHPSLKPGKSASIFHTADLAIACLTILNRFALPNDRLFVVKAREFSSIQFQVIYAPTRHHPLHVRLVPNKYNAEGDIPREYREALVDLLESTRL